MSIFKEFTKGFWKENPVLVLVLGMCPTLATSSFSLVHFASPGFTPE